MDFAKELAPAFANIGFNIGGLLLGLGYTNSATAPPTKEQIETVFREACEILNRTDSSNELFCNVTGLAPIADLFRDSAKLSMILGLILMSTGGSIEIAHACYRYCYHANANDQEENTPLGQTKHFIHRTVHTVSNTLFTVGGVLTGFALPSYLDEASSLPPSQQLLDGICEFFPDESNITMICNMDLLKRVAALFVQPSITTLWIGGGLIGTLGIVVVLYSLYQCLPPKGTGDDNENTPLQLHNNEQPTTEDGSDDAAIQLGGEK